MTANSAALPKLTKKQGGFLIFICWAAYATAYIGRLNYSASIVEIIAQMNITKEQAGLVSSFFFFAYGAGQLVNGILSKRYNTKYSVAASLGVSAVINIAMTFCPTVSAMKYLWFVNGIFQSVLWSSIIKTLSVYLDDAQLPKAVTVMSTTVALGTFSAYGLAALLSQLKADWKIIFYIASAILAAVAVLWFRGMASIEKHEKVTSSSENGKKENRKLSLKPAAVIGFAVLLMTAIANGFIKDGVTTWVPSILTEEFGVGKSLSIIVTLLLPILSVFGAQIVKIFHAKQKNTDILDGTFYLGSSVFILLIILTFKFRNTAVTLILFAFVACMMAAVNNVITSIIPLYSREKIDSGLLAGGLNTFCYIGSTLSVTLLGHIADKNSWSGVFTCILAFSATALVLSVISAIIKTAGNKKTR